MRPRSAQEKLLSLQEWPDRAAAARYDAKTFVEAMAHELGISAKSIQRFFKKHFQKSVQQQLDEFRIRKVEDLARNGCLAKQMLVDCFKCF